ncbi:Hypothetical predicted protein, partial [Mytilus galloprovincialis]
MKGNLEMRTMFGRNMALVLTKVNGYYYVNLYNNNPRNPGRCSLGWDEFIEMTAMRNVLEQLHSQFEDENKFTINTIDHLRTPQKSCCKAKLTLGNKFTKNTVVNPEYSRRLIKACRSPPPPPPIKIKWNGSKDEKYDWRVGRRVVELGVITDHLQKCKHCGLPPSLHNTINIKTYGLGFLVLLECCYLEMENRTFVTS